MPGSTSRRDQHEEPRDNTVDLPRIDVDGLTDHFRRAAPMLEPEPAGLLEPLAEQDSEPGSPNSSQSPSYLMAGSTRPSGLGHPYAEPDERPSPADSNGNPVAPTSSALDPSAPTPLAADPDTTDPDPAVPAAAASASETPVRAAAVAPTQAPVVAATPRAVTPVRSEAAPSAEPTKPARESSRPTADAGARDRSTVSGSTGRAPVGSHADLRSRLSRLPDGHPSSPYEDDGHARPLPIRLKQLELGLPAPGREVAAGVVSESEAAGDQPDTPQDSAKPERREPSAPDTPATAAPADESDRLAPTSPASSQRPDLTLGPWRANQPRRVSGLEGLSPRGGNGHSPANGHGSGSGRRERPLESDKPEPTTRDADRRDTAEYRIAEPTGPDVRELVERTLATGRAAEGRNVFGSYGSSGLTPVMQRVAAHLPFGGLALDSDANSLKSSERLTAKLARLVTRNPGRTAEELAATIGDVVRYAFAFEDANYVEGTWLVHRRLKSHGFELELRRNRWESPEYKGIFTQWRDPAHQIAFEVQFHTTASWAVVQRTHEAYVQITDPATPPAERARLRARQVAAAAAAKAPPNWTDLGDFRVEAR
jgi:hypothetical protein